MRIALVQRNSTIGDFSGIEETLRDAYEQACRQNADIVVYPELATTGYPPRDLLAREPFIAKNKQLVETMATWTAHGPAIVVGWVEPNPSPVGNRLFNSAAVLERGEWAANVQKSLLPSYDVFDEDRYFEPAQERKVVTIGGCKVGITICEDIWSSPEHWDTIRYPVDPCAELVNQGAEVLLNISASPFSDGKSEIRRRIVQEKAQTLGVPLVYVNQVGAHDELIFDGGSMVVQANGDISRYLPAFQDALEVVDIHSPSVSVPLRQRSREEDLYNALLLGVRDYVQKSGFQTVCLGLSGGIDSALTAVIAVDALGPENVHGLAMPSPYSSDHSVEDALQLAANLGCPVHTIPIGDTFFAMNKQLEPLFKGLEPDVTEENLQARIRGTTLMALSNKMGALLLTTGNKSEMAVGYCTLYGDMCGALAVIADVPKTWVYALCRWLNRESIRIPVRTIEKPPSAELRPGQVDSDSLPPYSILDAIIEGVVERGASVDDLSGTLDISDAELERVVRLIHLNEYKRRQAPPVLKVTSKAFGVGRRMPIVMKHSEWR